MQALVSKEIRENVKLAALGLVIYALLLLVQYRDYVASPDRLLQPLASGDLLFITMWFCGIFGAVLGWLQIHNERRPDLWAFLLHRPITRTQIFVGKMLAGLVVYAVVLGVPLLVFIAWARWPGHVAAPFELRMLRPLAATVLTGVVFYFAGMLTGLRQARWYASRALGLGMALIVCLMMQFRPVWWEGILVFLIGTAILIAALWGAFQTHGYYRGQALPARAALTFVLMLGSVVVAITAAALLSNLFPQSGRSVSWSYYVMTTNGPIYKVTQQQGGNSEIVDLEGKPLVSQETHIKVELAEFNRHIARSVTMGVGRVEPYRPQLWAYADLRLAIGWRATADTLWYYWKRYGRLVGYDVVTRRFVGSLGPNGFTHDLAGGGVRFSDETQQGSRQTLATATTLYRLDLEQRTVKPVFTTPADDPIVRSSDINFNVDESEQRYTAVVTKQFIYLLTRNGQPVWKVHYEENPAYREAKIYSLKPPGRFALWITPSRNENAHAENLPIHVRWLARDQGVTRSSSLPALPRFLPPPTIGEKLVAASAPPAFLTALPWLNTGIWNAAVPREALQTSWGIAVLVCLPLGLWLGRRYRLPLAAQVGWAAFHVLFGVPGLLAFLSVQEWSARVPCPACKRLRLVDRQHCEHCGAEFASPEKTGTEIFAPLVAGADFPPRNLPSSIA